MKNRRGESNSVAQVANLPYRRLAICMNWFHPKFAMTHRKTCRLPVGDTAECLSALRSRQQSVRARWFILLVASIFSLGINTNLSAHSGNQNVFYEGNIGPYTARIMIEKPDVVPGLAQISIRMLKGSPQEITVLPLKWNLGKQGAPTPDLAKPVRGEPTLFSAELWFMEGGSQSVEVKISGDEGTGEVLIPVAVAATKVETLPAGLGTVLSMLTVLLVLVFVGMVAAAVRESMLAAGEAPTRKRIWISRLAAVIAAALLLGGLYGGKKWWNAEASDYTNNRLFKPIDSDITTRVEGRQRVVRIEMSEQDLRERSPIVPDHGKLMHLVLVSQTNMNAMAHLHPLKLNRRTFVVAVPEKLPAGDYSVYAEVTYETGFSENIFGEIALPSPPVQSGSGVLIDIDPDDAWTTDNDSDASPLKDKRRIADLGDGFILEWLDSAVINAGEDLSLRFQVRSAAAADQPVLVQFYMGMMGHLFMRSHDGHLFTHLHPAGSFSMASQQLFGLRAEGKAPNLVNQNGGEPLCVIPGVDESLGYWIAQKSPEADYSFSFPWKFMNPGDYRIWVQVKLNGKIRTGVFDVKVWPEP